jgi:hypothetical protein
LSVFCEPEQVSSIALRPFFVPFWVNDLALSVIFQTDPVFFPAVSVCLVALPVKSEALLTFQAAFLTDTPLLLACRANNPGNKP